MPASQAKQAFWMVIGYFLLIPFCLMRAWIPVMSTINPYGRKPRLVSEWVRPWLNTVYGNYEDGVSGAEALIWPDPAVDPASTPLKDGRVLYRPNTWAPLRAWLWSAWRNSTNALSR
jgi:hypothetical protein